MGAKGAVNSLEPELNDEQEEEETGRSTTSKSRSQARAHMKQLDRLKEKDPEFYEFLKEHDKELLQFNDEDIDDADTDVEDVDIQIDGETGKHDISKKDEKPSEHVITSSMVDSWCNSIQENGNLRALRSLMRAFKTACHYGDDGGDDPSTKFSIMSSSVFNKIMLFVLSEMDSILRKLLKLPSSGGKKETIIDLMSSKQWKNFNHFVKSYLGNALHVLNQMTDTEMISFTLRRLKYSSIFLVAFPSLLRRYIKEAFRKVYEWKFINCLELWTGAMCAYGSEPDFRPLAYPLTQIISGVARLVPSASYFPLRVRCAKMLNRIAASTGTFIPVSMLLLDMLEMKELNRPPAGGVSKAVDLRTKLKVSETTLKTRAFQEACVLSVIEELAEHLAQWSYSVAFFELSFIPLVRLRSFCKTTKVERFRKEMRQLIRQIEASSEFTNERRTLISFLPNNPAATSFLEDAKKLGASPLSQYVLALRQRAQQRNASLTESSVLVGEHSSVFTRRISESDEEDVTVNEEGASVFSSSWLPGSDSKAKPEETKKKKKKRKMEDYKEVAGEEDVVEDLVLSSDEDESDSDTHSAGEDDSGKPVPPKQQSEKRKPPINKSKKSGKSRVKKSKKRKRAN
ncbi:nucleolar complex protein 2 homolog isoform X2 [Juglans microcarpa x Juglans regia]|uniref:nucleolar complex protein 2 homolog isoform X2 n=1 Tax=Juglans microcarpa x Juglans regia TaxID=2249226 RepID=UPI001B7EB7C1|nr:nucleolar complex protein 2 homolog isoform X2 [Juglans microcarpa x Juglans regia]